MANETLLVLSGPGVQPYSARGLKQTLTPIGAAANNRRTINGDLLDLSQQQFRKYASTISCSDQLAPALDGVWPGLVLTVDCVAELAYKTVGSSRTDGAYTFYRPRLTMRVMNYNMDEDEYGRVLAWSLELEEA
jgi:hypothetical protein